MKNIFGILMLFACTAMATAQGAFKLPPLPYTYGALEPWIDAQTMEIHWSKHHAAYVNNLNKAMAEFDTSEADVIKICKNISKYNEAVRNNAGGHYNHSLFWMILSPDKTEPSAHLLAAINAQFGSLDSLKMLINKAASARFGSGWAWLSVGDNQLLRVSSTPNQDNPLMDIVQERATPILGIDVWEHAYYLKYQNRRGDYLNAIWNVINWNEVSRRYEELVPRKKKKSEWWPALGSFHKVMSETFHPSEEGDLTPIKSRSGEMSAKAAELAATAASSVFNSVEVNALAKKLSNGAKRLDKLVKSKAKDELITRLLNELHDTYHALVDACVLPQ